MKVLVLSALGVAAMAGGVFAVETDHSVAVSAPAARNPLWAAPVEPAWNLYRITPDLYRSEQPRPGDAARIQSLGIRTIISLRDGHGDEGMLSLLPGVTLVRIPMNTWDIDDVKIVTALRAIQQGMARGPVLIHCQHGSDRTGVVSAMYRMVEQHWTREQAVDELRHGGYGFHAIWFNIPHYLKTVNVESVRRKVEQGG